MPKGLHVRINIISIIDNSQQNKCVHSQRHTYEGHCECAVKRAARVAVATAAVARRRIWLR